MMIDEKDGAAGANLAGGLFFLGWAAVGWYSYFTSPGLAESLWAPGFDPGPAMLPVLCLSTLSLGGLYFVAAGIARFPGMERTRRMLRQKAVQMARPVAFLATILLEVLAITRIGFIAPAFVFTTLWIFLLSPGTGSVAQRLAVAAVLSILLTLAVHFTFVRLLGVLLP
ncbi:tripartite tricarboxylate transporter TctB family protein [Rhizobiaceae bacterium BDR2-2]|uniref:Tripartite tricarboxylate transporter TctB family protein n=1 Tax=Ectorhizobium quercum TaxID=2965071 RepID=A0AAE3SWF6_9HYPH|nr:tripartite tricarboxylate transporter TctB family protein [Ectorhizobium quercum]MCX8997974.1 tripartite tricarboxylate transporter TctB family protein [Ectorhizobium quercum]